LKKYFFFTKQGALIRR